MRLDPDMNHAERMRQFAAAGLYLVTSQAQSAGRSTPDIVAAALRGGVRLIQLREKELCARDLLAMAHKVRELTARRGALLIVNDRLDIAMAVGADGVHLGQTDLPVAEARKLAPDMLIGASSHSVAEAGAAEAAGASYVNIGPLFPTQTKEWRGAFIGIDGMRRIAAVLTVPFTVMGGIKEHHIAELAQAGARIFAMVTAVTAAADPECAARRIGGLAARHAATSNAAR